MKFKKAARTAQTYAGPLLEAKAWSQRKLRSVMRVPSEPSYRAFRRFPFAAEDQFLDIGANRGQTIASLRLYHKNVNIMAFEPNPVLSARLAARYSSDLATTVLPFGLGEQRGNFLLYVPYYRGFMFDGLASFEWSSAHGWLNNQSIYRFNERHLRIEEVRCEVKPWDEVPTRPALVKIDVQGFETHVLRSGLNTIRDFRPIFLIENDSERAYEDVLFPEHYRRAAYDSRGLTMDSIGSGNTFYVPEEKVSHLVDAYIRDND